MRPDEFITGDTHWGHGNIVRQDFAGRPWPVRPPEIAALEDRVVSGKAKDDERSEFKAWLRENIHIMDEELIVRWNAKVPKGARVFHVGDFSMAGADRTREVRSRLNGQIVLIFGNHDRGIKGSLVEMFESVQHYLETKTPDGTKVCMFHYPMAHWNKSHHGSWHLHGHSHGEFPDDGTVRRLDVGVDCHPNYEPFSYDEILERMQGRGDSFHHERKPRAS